MKQQWGGNSKCSMHDLKKSPCGSQTVGENSKFPIWNEIVAWGGGREEGDLKCSMQN
jgi:hypothetical protein